MVTGLIFLGIVWVVVGVIICGWMVEDADADNHHFIMAGFWPVTLAVFLVIGPFIAFYYSVRMLLATFKED